MIPLDSPKWHELQHAYGSASDVPGMLRELEDFPLHDGYEASPYYMLWSSLCHQGDAYVASYASVPHIIRILESAPDRAHSDFFLLPACIEIARATGRGPEVPEELRAPYFSALQRIPEVVAAISASQWNEEFCRVVTAAIAVAKGQPALGEAILELEPDAVDELMKQRFE